MLPVTTMLDLQQGFTVPCHQLRSSVQGCHQANAQPASEFEFWHATQRGLHGSFDGNKLKAAAPPETEDCFHVYSPPMWKVLPRNQRYHGRCHQRSEAEDTITAGRTELMEMIQKMPESSHELSFSDMIDAEASKEAEDGDSNVEEKLDFSGMKTPMISKGKNQEKRKLKPCHQMSRIESMDGGNFLLKMFWPSCFAATETRDGRKLAKIPQRSTSSRVSRGLASGGSGRNLFPPESASSFRVQRSGDL